MNTRRCDVFRPNVTAIHGSPSELVEEPHWTWGEGSTWYSMFGLHVRSDVPLLLHPVSRPPGVVPAYVFRNAGVGSAAPEPEGRVVLTLRCRHGVPIAWVHRGTAGTWMRHRSLATCRISPDARWVDVYPEAQANEQVLGFVLTFHVSILVLHLLGYPVLHASAVVTERGSVAFIGPRGQGKSTMAAYFLRRGAALLTDDALPLRQEGDGIVGVPGLPLMKILSDTAECVLELSRADSNLVASSEKKVLSVEEQYSFAQEPAHLSAIYVLNRYDPTTEARDNISIETLGKREGITTLVAQTSLAPFLYPTEATQRLLFYARLLSKVPMRVLSYPNGFEYQEAVYEHIMADLEER